MKMKLVPALLHMDWILICKGLIVPETLVTQHQALADELSSTTMPQFDARHDHVLLFQYGKVASSSFERPMGQLMRQSRLRFYERAQEHYPRGVKTHQGDVAADMLSKVPNGSQVWVITATRHRRYRDTSMYFQTLHHAYSVRHVKTNMTMTDLHEDFRKRFRADGYKDDWFTEPFERVTGVNIVEHADKLASSSHDHIALRHRWEGKQLNLNIVLLRFEDIAKWEGILQKYFPGFHLQHSNSEEAKWYADMYIDFLKTYRMLQYEIDAICGGETLKFYSTEEKRVVAPECDPSLSFAHTDAVFESAKLHVETSDTDLMLADLSVDGYDDDDDML